MGKCTINGKEYAFSVGDRVRIREDLAKCPGINCEGEMNHWAGEIMTITRFDGSGYRMLEDSKENDGTGWCWADSMIEGLAPSQSIHITSDGKTTHAVLKDGNKVVKRSKAICSPADTFDFETGARVAFDRLISPEVREVKRPAKVGEWVKATRSDIGYVAGEVLQVISGVQSDTPCIYVRTENPTYYDGGIATHKIKLPFALMNHAEYVVLENYQPPAEPAKPELPKFTYAGFKRGDFVVNCRTQGEADIFCAYLHGKGDRWRSGDSYVDNTCWGKYKDKTCYSGNFGFGRVSPYEAEGISVIPFNAADLD